MFECGNDQPEKEVTDEVKKIVQDIQPQLEEKLGKSLDKVEATKFSSQITNKKTYYIKLDVDGSWIHVKVHQDFDDKPTVQDIQEGKSEEDPCHYF